MLRCADNTLYTGVTTDPERRLREHNGEVKGGARYTRTRQPVTMVWQEVHANRSDACKREAQIKRISKSAKEKLIIENS
ncbi:GIY-YIG nuclease family protein [Pontibacterium granulatum]|nr:GIY-YIG nuclease family protein [Pontibacterium granulatum]MDI3323538.1 GIY-YIG nuclease family protein [Pontibacterium granulatum]